MNTPIRSLDDLNAQINQRNIETAWQISHRWSKEHVDELMRVSIEQLHRAAGCGEPCLSRLGIYDH